MKNKQLFIILNHYKKTILRMNNEHVILQAYKRLKHRTLLDMSDMGRSQTSRPPASVGPVCWRTTCPCILDTTWVGSSTEHTGPPPQYHTASQV